MALTEYCVPEWCGVIGWVIGTTPMALCGMWCKWMGVSTHLHHIHLRIISVNADDPSTAKLFRGFIRFFWKGSCRGILGLAK